MFEQLIESNHKKKSSLSQTVISLALHAGVIFGAVKATQVRRNPERAEVDSGGTAPMPLVSTVL